MNDRMAVYYYKKGLELARDNFIGDAVEDLKKAVSLNDKNTVAWNLLGLCCYRLGRYKTAEYCWQESLLIAPAQKDVKEYLADLRMVTAKFFPVINTVQELAARGLYKKATRLFEQEIIRVFDPAAEVLSYGGVLRCLAGSNRRAVKLWKQALELNRSDTRAVGYIMDRLEQPGFFAGLYYRLLRLWRND